MTCKRVVIINDFTTANGGASAIAIENALVMVEQGLEVVFISADGAENPTLINSGVSCVSLNGEAINPNNPVKGLLVGLHNTKAQHLINDWIRNNDDAQTVYHVHCWSKIYSPSIYLALKQVSDRLVIHAHDYFPVCPNGAFVHYPTNTDCSYKPCGFKCLTSACDQRSQVHKVWRYARGVIRNRWINFKQTKTRVILLHHAMESYFLRGDYGKHNLTVVPNPVRPYANTRIQAEHNQQFVFIGTVVPAKGADTFLAAARKAGVPAKVIGDGECLAALKADYPEAEFVGWQNHVGIAAHLTSARAVVMPSKLRETFGLVTIESCASGLPVIVSNKSPLAEDVADLNLGEAVQPEDVDAIAALIQSFAMDDERIKAMSEKGVKEWGKLALTPKAWGEAILNIYDEMVAN